MNTPELNVKDSLSNSHQGAVLAAMGAFGDKFKSFFSEPAQHLSTVVSRLGVGAAAMAIVAVAGLAAPGQAQAQWGNASPWATQGGIDKSFQQQRQLDLAQQAGRVVGDARGLNYKEQNIVGLLGQIPGAVTTGSKAASLGALATLGAAVLVPASNTSNGTFLNGGNNGGNLGGNNGGGVWANAAPWGGGNNGGYSGNNGGYGQQQVNAQTQAVQVAFARYQQLAEPQFQIAVQANLDGQLAARDEAIVKFGNHWNAASQMGIPLSNSPDQVAKFQMLSRMNPSALQHGLQTRVAEQPQMQGQYQMR